jgi:hypothetical protein
LVVTYKPDTTGDIPVTNGFVEASKPTENMTEVRDVADIPVIDRSPAKIVETIAKGEPPLSALFAPRVHSEDKSFAYPYLMPHGVPWQSDAAQASLSPMYFTTAAFKVRSWLSINFVADHADGVSVGVEETTSLGF